MRPEICRSAARARAGPCAIDKTVLTISLTCNGCKFHRLGVLHSTGSFKLNPQQLIIHLLPASHKFITTSMGASTCFYYPSSVYLGITYVLDIAGISSKTTAGRSGYLSRTSGHETSPVLSLSRHTFSLDSRRLTDTDLSK